MRMLQALRESVVLPPLPNEEITLNPADVVQYTQSVHDVLRNAVSIDCSNIADYFWNTYCNENNFRSLWDDLHVLAPPFPRMFFEWNILVPDFAAFMKRMGFYVNALPAESAETFVRSFYGENAKVTPEKIREMIAKHNPRWIFISWMFIEFKRSPDPLHVGNVVDSSFRGPYGSNVTAVADDGSFLNHWSQFPTTLPEEEAGQLAIAGLIGLLALAMMNCKNIITREHAPPAKLQKARKKRNKTPLIKHYTIHVDPNQRAMAQKAMETGPAAPRGRGPIKGHMKDYRAGKGLFGRLKGVYYFGPHLRGDAKAGVLIPDYELKDKR